VLNLISTSSSSLAKNGTDMKMTGQVFTMPSEQLYDHQAATRPRAGASGIAVRMTEEVFGDLLSSWSSAADLGSASRRDSRPI